MNRRLALLVLASVVGACESKPPTSPTVDLSGRWDGTIESATDGTGSVRLDLTQAGRTVRGTTHLAQSGPSDVPGAFLGTLASETLPTTIQYTVTYEYGFQCQGTFSGTLVIGSHDAEGSYSGQNCVHAFEGRLRATRAN